LPSLTTPIWEPSGIRSMIDCSRSGIGKISTA